LNFSAASGSFPGCLGLGTRSTPPNFFSHDQSVNIRTLDTSLSLGKMGPKELPLRGVTEAELKELSTGVESGRWATAEAARIWLAFKQDIGSS
jgi:hypothetical protein